MSKNPKYMTRGELIEKLSAVERQAWRLAAALNIALYDAHPVYGSTAGWGGGIGGQTITTGCSMINPPPRDQWMDAGLDLLSTPLREWMKDHQQVLLRGFKLDLQTECEEAYRVSTTRGSGS